MKLFHGSPNKFITEFSLEAPSRYTPLEGNGLYLTADYKIARSYAGSEGSVYEVNVAKLKTLDFSTREEFDFILNELSRYIQKDLSKLEGLENTIEGLMSGHYRIRPGRDAGLNFQIKNLLDSDEIFHEQSDTQDILDKLDSWLYEYFNNYSVMKYHDLKLGIVWLGLKPEQIKIVKEINVCSEDEHEYL